VIADEQQETLTLFAVNKDLKSDYSVTMDVRQFAGYQVQEHILLTNEDLKAVNTEEKPDNVVPVLCENSKVEDGTLKSVLPARSWNVVRLKKTV
jgi:alpha-N-arabinofuranosidase